MAISLAMREICRDSHFRGDDGGRIVGSEGGRIVGMTMVVAALFRDDEFDIILLHNKKNHQNIIFLKFFCNFLLH